MMNVTRLTPGDFPTIEHFLERIARVSRASEDKAGADTATFLRTWMIQAGHHSIGEHATFRVTLHPSASNEAKEELLDWLHDNSTVAWTEADDGAFVLGVNARHLLEVLTAQCTNGLQRGVFDAASHLIGSLLQDSPPRWRDESCVVRDVCFAHKWPTQTGIHDPSRVTYATFLVEGISRVTETQFVRHRSLSFLFQSGRAVDYSNAGFVWPEGTTGEDEMIGGCFDGDPLDTAPLRPLVRSNLWHEYVALRARGVPKQDARYFLPLGMETRGVVTGSIYWWTKFLRDRLAPAAQWEIRSVATKIQELLNL